MVYVGTLMTENAFYPIFLWLAFALLLMLERPTLARQLAVLALCMLAFVTRAQTVALVAAVLTAPLALAWIERGRPRRLGAYKALYGIVAGGAALVVVVELARGRSPSHILGNYSKTSNGGYHVWPALKWLVLHVAELDLYVWILPFAALIVLVANARHLDRPLRVFAAATASLCVWLVLEVAVFASRYSLRIEERNLFYLAPLLVVALLAWIERGQPRPPRAAVVAAGLAAALPGAIPFLHLLNITAQSDTLGFQPWWYVGGAWAGLSSVSIAVVLVSIALGAMFLWLPRRWAPVLPVLVALGFLATWIPLEQWKHGFPQLSKSALAQGIGRTDNSWIDSAVGRNAHVAVLWSGGNELSAWENEFWNRSIDRVYSLGTPLPGDMPTVRVAADQATGVLVGLGGRKITDPYVLASNSVDLVGKVVARDSAKQLRLYRVTSPARVTTVVTGLYPTSAGVSPWSNATPAWTRLQCAGGTLTVVVSSDTRLFEGARQKISVTGTTPARTIRISPSTDHRPLVFPLTPQHGVCRVAFEISPARKPSEFVKGSQDTRLLGLHFNAIRYSPPK
jgi:hypothetical protein